MGKNTDEFGMLRSILWPIHRSECKKILSLVLLFFLLCVSYSLLRNLKDTVLLNARGSGAEVLPFIKLWGMLPAAIIGTWGYTQLCVRFGREKVFYILVSAFLLFFLTFALLVYPNCDKVYLEKVANFLTQHLPYGCKGFIAMVCNWSLSLFYIICELWSILVLSILFWGFSNDVTPVSEAKRSYGILNIGSNIAPAVGSVLGYLSASKLGGWEGTLINIVMIVTVLGLLAMILYRWINKNVLEEADWQERKRRPKERLSIRASVRYLLKSRYLCFIAVLVLGFNIAINFTDILWKDRLKSFFTDPADMFNHLNFVQAGIGIIAVNGAVFFSILVRKLGWTFVAILTPAIMSIMGIFFFGFLFCGDLLSSVTFSLCGLTPVAMTVYFGSLQNCFSKAGKYSVFDGSKELAFLPLDQESKQRGKAAIDGLGSGIGKSGASLMYQGLLILTGSIALSTPYIAGILFMVFSAWIYSVVNLGKQFNQETESAVSSELKQESSVTP